MFGPGTAPHVTSVVERAKAGVNAEARNGALRAVAAALPFHVVHAQYPCTLGKVVGGSDGFEMRGFVRVFSMRSAMRLSLRSSLRLRSRMRLRLLRIRLRLVFMLCCLSQELYFARGEGALGAVADADFDSFDQRLGHASGDQNFGDVEFMREQGQKAGHGSFWGKENELVELGIQDEHLPASFVTKVVDVVTSQVLAPAEVGDDFGIATLAVVLPFDGPEERLLERLG